MSSPCISCCIDEEVKRLEKENAELKASTITHDEWYAKCNEVAELKRKLFKAEIERQTVFEDYDKLRSQLEASDAALHESRKNDMEAMRQLSEVRAKLDAWEKQSPIGYVCKCEDYTGSIISDYKEWDDYSTPLFTKPKE